MHQRVGRVGSFWTGRLAVQRVMKWCGSERVRCDLVTADEMILENRRLDKLQGLLCRYDAASRAVWIRRHTSRSSVELICKQTTSSDASDVHYAALAKQKEIVKAGGLRVAPTLAQSNLDLFGTFAELISRRIISCTCTHHFRDCLSTELSRWYIRITYKTRSS